ncbi:acetyl-CoA carboxylase biotin carboxylase subunit [Phyllobacterium meliloti]|uniref:acetyl-CoA carboxylase biotin carboxylase subunit n=1 Tax=Phyllobacterium meliloti TaxID=555317 RepID=UPI001D134741|nr:acetyl-CoA carboxylase biotin carboxylase subunit [Phyllobacterium sp. T1293]UGX89209.1 acetyl-CoA carboxylase biotin carboxylase subunit [Phyllobacterium sp. T1293]
MNISSVLIANRGEIAVRINRAAKALGLRTVQVYSAADANSLAVKLADEAIEIGPATAKKSYLNIDTIIAAAIMAEVDAVHPGYGFLAENADFADAVIAAGMKFVGPDGASIRLLGDKVAARNQAEKAGVPTVPGSGGRIADVEEAAAIASAIGFPVMIKAAAGGGGRGIRVAQDIDEFKQHFPQASAEAAAAFGDGGLYIEKAILNARHIEVQMLGDGKNFVHCYERECSLQRRRQKVWEEAPAVGLPESVRQRLCDSAVSLARSVGYSGAGTVEYLYDEASQKFYFLEVNTRIQVEHPVTEMITGLDLVQEMLRIAGGETLSVRQQDIAIKGHAIECRINAEDPSKDFMPFPGTIDRISVPVGKDIRFDTMLFQGYVVPPFYDSLLGKLIVHGADRAQCLARLTVALSELKIDGIPTTIPLHAALAKDPDIAIGHFHTRFLENWLETRFNPPASSDQAYREATG